MEHILSLLVPIAIVAALLYFKLRPKAAVVIGQKIVSPLSQVYLVGGAATQFASITPQPGPSGISLSKTPQGTRLSIDVTSASVRIRRDGSNDAIIVKANFPSNWRVDGQSIAQVAEVGPQVLTEGSNLAFFGIALQRTVIEASRVQVSNGEVRIDGNVVKPIFEGDQLEVIVPANFTGSLSVNNHGSDEVTIDDWKGGSLSLTSTGGGDFKGGYLSGLSSLTIDIEGNGAVDFGAIEADNFSATLENGNFEVSSVKSGAFAMKVVGTGDITSDTIELDAGTLELTEQSNCNVAVGELRASRKLTIESLSSGDVEITTIKGGEFTLTFASSSNFTNETVEAEAFSFECADDATGDFNADSLTASRSLALTAAEGSNCNFNIGSVDSERTQLRSHGVGDVEISTIRGGSFEGSFGSNSNFNLTDDVQLAAKFDLEMVGTGDASLSNVNADDVALLTTDNANVSIGWMTSKKASFKNEGSGTVELEDGNVDSLELAITDSGDINVCGTFAALHTSKTGSGSLNIS
jgi:hypothetical protein